MKDKLIEKVNSGFEIVYRFTNTVDLVDVINTHVDPSSFPILPDCSFSLAEILNDRSGETGDSKIGFVNGTGRQRGFPKQKDAYVMAEFTFSFNLSSYHCPKAD